MIGSTTFPISLSKFLELPETKPASEFIQGEIQPKAMPQGEHSHLQSKLCTVINAVGETKKIAYGFSELRCSFGGDSIIPDIAVFKWHNIPVSESGTIANRFEIAPDWVIEILSPDQSSTKVLRKLLYCSQYGTEIGWLIDPDDESILVVFPEQKVQYYRHNSKLPLLSELDLVLTVEQIFAWLTWQ
ncbi:MAG: Uma2 family endonuclease [Microcystaceae cyanobacterium]